MQFFKKAAAASAIVSTTSASWVLSFNATKSGLEGVYPSTVSFANSTMFLGSANYNIYSEPIVTSTKGSLGFTSYHQAPTDFTEPYVHLNAYNPVYYTTPHSGYYVPPGGNHTDFSFDSEGYLQYGGENQFVACQAYDYNAGKYAVFWVGHSQYGPGEDYTCTGPLYLY